MFEVIDRPRTNKRPLSGDGGLEGTLCSPQGFFGLAVSLEASNPQKEGHTQDPLRWIE